MDFHHPPLSAARARRRPSWTRLVGVTVVASVAVTSCGSAGDDAADVTDGLPAELAADGTDTGDGQTDAGAVDDLDGFGAVEDVEAEPAQTLDTDAVDLTGDEPAEVIEQVADEVAAADDGQELLDAVEPVDEAGDPPAEPDGRTRNGSGELVELDAEASLACANVEIAIGQLDDGLAVQAGELVRSGAAQADASAIADIQSWAQPLLVAADTIDDPAPLVGFLTVCTEGGYEL